MFLGGNLVWLVGCLTSWGAVFFAAVSLQVTLGLRPLFAGLLLTPIYLVMMVGAPLAGRVAERFGARVPILAGLAVYVAGLWLLGRTDATSSVVPDVIAAVLVLAVGMAGFSAPLAAITLASLDDADQGLASGINNATSQLAGLLGVVLLPAAAGLSGLGFGDPGFAAGASRAYGVMALLVVACLPVAWWITGRSTPLPARPGPIGAGVDHARARS
jgi:MFS family permease